MLLMLTNLCTHSRAEPIWRVTRLEQVSPMPRSEGTLEVRSPMGAYSEANM